MAEDDKNYTIIDGKKIPVYNAKVVETIKNKTKIGRAHV